MRINSNEDLKFANVHTNKLVEEIYKVESSYLSGNISYSLGVVIGEDDSRFVAIDFSQLRKHCKKFKLTKMFEHLLAKIMNCNFTFQYFADKICDDAPTTYLIVDHEGDVTYLLESLLKANPIYNTSIIIKGSVSLETKLFPNLKYPSDEEERKYVNPVEITNNFSEDNKVNFLKVNTHKDLLLIFDDNRIQEISLVVPKQFKSIMDNKTYNLKKCEEIVIEGFTSFEHSPIFLSQIGNKCECIKYYGITYNELISLEKACDIFQVNETLINYNDENSLIFYAKEKENCLSFKNIVFLAIGNSKSEERQIEMVNDVISLVPVRYFDKQKIIDNCCIKNNFLVENIITGIIFQEYFECGSTSQTERTFADRISRYDLGSIIIQPLEELHYNYFAKIKTPAIGDAINARLIVAIDNDTQAAVLYICALAIKNLPTKYLDDISRNEVFINVSKEVAEAICKTNEKICCKKGRGKYYINLSDYLSYQFEIEFVGAPRNLIISPKNFEKLESKLKKSLSSSDLMDDDDCTLDFQILSSLLYGESYFDESEELGQIIDPDIFYSIKNKWGWSLYNYAKTFMAKTSVIQAAETYRDYVLERVDFEVVTLYYIELVLFESSAIQIATNDISEYIKNYRIKKPWYIKLKDMLITSSGQVLRKIEHIQGEYAKTIDFWDVQMSYYSSKKMLDFIRLNFDINNDLEQLERTRNETEGIYQSKKTNISNRNGLILAIMGLILTISSIYEIFMNYRSEQENPKDLHDFETFFFDNVSEVLLVKIIAIIVIAILLIRFTTVKIFDRHKK